MILYHGSSRKFTRFSRQYFYSGEGNMSFGAGVYLAGHIETGKHYAMVAMEANKARMTEESGELLALQSKLNQDRVFRRGADNLSVKDKENIMNKISTLKYNLTNFKSQLIKLIYKVEIPNNILTNFLNMDAKFDQQKSNVKTSLKKIFGETLDKDLTGLQMYRILVDSKEGHENATNILENSGIKGTIYLDAVSRGKNGGTYNYVVFDPSNVKIKECYEL